MKTTLMAVTFDQDGILSADSIGTVVLTNPPGTLSTVDREWLEIHLANVCNELRHRLESRGGKVEVRA